MAAVPFSMFIEPRARSTSASSGEIAVGGAKPAALGCAPGTGDRPVGDAPTIPAMASATSEAPAGAARRRFECVDRVCIMLPPFRVEDSALNDWSSARSRAGTHRPDRDAVCRGKVLHTAVQELHGPFLDRVRDAEAARPVAVGGR